MSDIILKAENISKQYRLGSVGVSTIAHDANRFWHKIRGKEDPYLKIGSVNDRSVKASSDYVWALQDINFEVKKGEVLGIIGKNGAGKSTLLKLLSRVTAPTTGVINAGGRIASLLEVGTGMHPELTGRENIFLNGAILGMSKSEIKSKIDEIITFSGCEMYIDTPVKRYSSGMRVRLGFAVAAFLEPEILVVDEVLAVGDVEFQKKAIGKMQDISKGGGRTILFVSHNMASIKALCTKGMLLDNGSVSFYGDINECVSKYLDTNVSASVASYYNETPENEDILSIKVLKGNEISDSFGFDQKITLYFKIQKMPELKNSVLAFRIQDVRDRNIFSSQINMDDQPTDENVFEFTVDLPVSFLLPNNYFINVGFHIPNVKVIRKINRAVGFFIEETGSEFHIYGNRDLGCVAVKCDWKLLK